MDGCHNFSENIKALIKLKHESLTEFAQELHIPKSTLQSILHDGQTTLHTALLIAEHLDMPLSALTDGLLNANMADTIQWVLQSAQWYAVLPKEKQDIVRQGIDLILEAIRE